MTRFLSFPFALTAALTLTLTACGGSDSPASTDSPPPSVAPSDPTPSGPVTRSEESLAKGLLELSDLPSGFTREEDDEPDSGTKPFGSSSSRCKPLVKLMNAAAAPAADFTAGRSFSGGPSGPYLDFSLDAMGTAEGVATLRAKYAEAVTDCPKISMRSEGGGSTVMQIDLLTAPEFGTEPLAFRLMGVDGPRRGLEYNTFLTGIGDVALSVEVMAGDEQILATAAEAAVVKAQSGLGSGQ
ncbi:hypothetical protein HPO96_04280 [Kribbella sandramycini]|uniref:PknH-like protein n=1 Tax=Kribbella sandramycini TaxID=60450 RepID=A0A7Y4KVG8_9ACTN|nr:hypothetical protein [Kribbella sandramycini]MBB6567947.1 hypothetical protein [Kribbella sandramycini]NOL39458.1 hypothetical protein [Kribbella sandramycini]